MAKVTGGMKSVFGDIMAGNLFMDSSTHSNDGHGSAHGSSGTASSTTGTSSTASGNFKSAVGGVTAGLAFKKPTNPVPTTASQGSRK